jgi:hypothetical protein
VTGSTASTSGGSHFRSSAGGEHLTRLDKTRKDKKIFLQAKSFRLMRYNKKQTDVQSNMVKKYSQRGD